MSDIKLPDNAPRPRLCHVTKWPDFDGYGFNLHAEKSRPGQFIGQVDEMSPAEMSGLKEGDRIVEVRWMSGSKVLSLGLKLHLEMHAEKWLSFPFSPDFLQDRLLFLVRSIFDECNELAFYRFTTYISLSSYAFFRHCSNSQSQSFSFK